jgi:hypothetical protein
MSLFHQINASHQVVTNHQKSYEVKNNLAIHSQRAPVSDWVSEITANHVIAHNLHSKKTSFYLRH